MTEQRQTFDQVAELYDRTRPGVPADAVEGLCAAIELGPDTHVVEVGCGTGQLTVHLVERGARVTAVEPGGALAAVCARKTGDSVTFVHARLEDWTPARPYDALVACQAAHWIAPETFLDRADVTLAAGGHVGLLWHLDTSRGSDFWQATEPLYERYLPDADDRPPRTLPDLVANYARAIRADGRFRNHVETRWPWTREFDEDAYLLFLRTHSPVRMLSEADREAFIAGHAKVIRELGGKVTRTYETVLHATCRA